MEYVKYIKNLSPVHHRIMEALTDGAASGITDKTGICFVLPGIEIHPIVRVGIARWNFSGDATIFEKDDHVVVSLFGGAVVSAHTTRKRFVCEDFRTCYRHLCEDLDNHIRKIHW